MRIVLRQVMLMLGLGVSAGKKAGINPCHKEGEHLHGQFTPYRYTDRIGPLNTGTSDAGGKASFNRWER